MPLNNLPTEFKGRKESIMLRRPDVTFALEILGMGPIDTRVLSFVNGRLTLRQIVAGARMKKRMIYKILYGLYLTGVIGFPESVIHERRDMPVRPAKEAKAKARPADKGYEISAADDLIAQAMQSVDRIHREAVAESQKEAEAIQIRQPAPVAPVPAVEEFGAKVDEMLKPEEQAEIDEHFGFDEGTEDGFAQQEAEEDDTLQEMTDSSEFIDPLDPLSGPGDDAFMQDEDVSFKLDEVEPVKFEEAAFVQEEDEDLDESGPQYNLNVDDFSSPDEIFKQGVSLLQEGYFDEAEEFLSRALEMMPENSQIHAHLGWAIYNAQNQTGDNLRRAESIIKEGMRGGKATYYHFLYLGKIYASENQLEFAELHFVKALEMNVDCAEAREQIKLIHSR